MLAELHALAIREGLASDPDYTPKAVSYVVVIGDGGKLLSVLSTLQPSPNGKGKPKPKRMSVPREQVRSSKPLPQFLWDNAGYVFGFDPTGKKSPELLARCCRLFRAEVQKAADETHDAALVDVAAFLASAEAAPVTVQTLERHGVKDVESNAVFAFRHASDSDGLVTDRKLVRAYWKKRCATESSAAGMIQCLVTGQSAPPIESHPQIRKIPGALPKGVPLVSFNNSAFESYGLARNENAPIGEHAARAIAEALSRLLDRDYPNPHDNTPMPSRRFDLGNDTAVLFWAREEDAAVDIFAATMIDANPDQVRALYDAPEVGRPPALSDPTPFFAMALSGELARAKVRGWFETTVGQALTSVRAHFDDIAIVQPASRENLPMALWSLLRSVAPLGDRTRLAPSLATATFAAILTGHPYPYALLEGAVRRARVDHDVTPERAALIKGYLVRARRADGGVSKLPEVKTRMDTENKNVPYRLGRLFAALEKLQEDAHRPGKLNATIRDRYFGAASATPVTVFARLIRGAQAHLSKLDGGVYYQKVIQEIVAPVPAFPSSMTLEEQGLFALGYYHQRQAFFEKRPASDQSS